MIGRKREFFSQLYQLMDSVLLGFAFWFSHFLRTQDYVVMDVLPAIPPFSDGLWMLAVLMPFGPLLLEAQGFYQPQHRNRIPKRISQMAMAGIWLILILGLCVIFLRVEVPSRSVLILLLILGPVLLLVRDSLSEVYHRRGVREGRFFEPIILAGEPHSMKRFLKGLPDILRQEFHVVQTVDLTQHPLSHLVDELHRHSVGRVVLCFDHLDVRRVQEAVTACEIEGVEVWLDAGFIRTTVARPTFENLSGQPMLVFRTTPDISWSLFIKGILDRVLSALALLVLAPFLLLVALGIKWTSPGPVLFRQTRSGLHGRKFVMFKFRSMVADAETRRSELESHNEMRGPVFKIQKDPRVTPLGRFLRRTSIDELPQLFNVLRGEMSLVGPRPLPDYEVARFDELSYRRRLSVKPGLTCLWQIKGRNQVTDFAEWIRLDLEYIDNWSLGLDFLILVRTVPAVLAGRGAV